MILKSLLYGCPENQTYQDQLQFNCSNFLNFSNIRITNIDDEGNIDDRFEGTYESTSRQNAYGVLTILSYCSSILTIASVCMVNQWLISKRSDSTRSNGSIKFFQTLSVWFYKLTVLLFVAQQVLMSCNYAVHGVGRRYFYPNFYMGWLGVIIGLIGIPVIEKLNYNYNLKIATVKNRAILFTHFVALSFSLFSSKNWNTFEYIFTNLTKGTSRGYYFRSYQCLFYFMATFMTLITCNVVIFAENRMLQMVMTLSTCLCLMVSVVTDTIAYSVLKSDGGLVLENDDGMEVTGITTLWLADDNGLTLLHAGDSLYFAYSFAWIASFTYLGILIAFYRAEVMQVFDLAQSSCRVMLQWVKT